MRTDTGGKRKTEIAESEAVRKIRGLLDGYEISKLNRYMEGGTGLWVSVGRPAVL